MRIAELEHRRVAVWGYGREGRAAIAAIRRRLPQLPLTLFCSSDEAASGTGIDDIRSTPPDAAALAAFEVVVKSPGISAYRPELLAARERGTHFTSGTALWFAENPDARVVAITGTKGKSTTSALTAHLARSLGIRTALAGNIGLPLLELLDQAADLWVIELSSFQTGEAGPLELGVVTSLYEEHLDWHGSRERYVADKLKLAAVSRALLVNATQANLLQQTIHHPRRLLFGDAAGWHVTDGWVERGETRMRPTAALSVPGAHNALNACAALAVLERLGLDAPAALPALSTFMPLPHRLQRLGLQGGRHWINDSISTTPEATLAALASLAGAAVSVIVGGFDRGLDWSHFAEAMHAHAPHAIVTQGANGPRIAAALRTAGIAGKLIECATLDQAIDHARESTPAGGTVLLSPGAPSFDQFHDYADRGRHFADRAGFDGHAISGIAGLGIA
ncbi:MAG TPA: UDP-N-acetylmuramoyl-L-alanine--D-glutamate ligase [Rhodanobacteraceae bacterium]|nr:UDP-N-acetylmuramoyl-L-alanine--D-glutamate ligase [Rhodanobacteraceae bacterium]